MGHILIPDLTDIGANIDKQTWPEKANYFLKTSKGPHARPLATPTSVLGVTPPVKFAQTLSLYCCGSRILFIPLSSRWIGSKFFCSDFVPKNIKVFKSNK